MIKVRDGYGKLIGSDYNGNIAHVLLSNGGNLQYAVGSTASTLVQRNASGQIESSVASTVAPFVISSTKVNANLNADLLDGFQATGLFQSLTSAADKNLYIKIGDTEKEVPLLYASYLGGVTKEGLFTELTNVNDSTNPNSIKVTIGDTTKYLKVSYADNAASASKVGKKLIIKTNPGATEGTNLYTFDGSADKTINFVAGSNITITPTANTLTIASSYVNTTYTLSGALTDSDKTYTVTLTPNSGNPTTAVIPSMTGATSSASGKAGLVPVPATGNRLQFLRGDGTWQTPTNTKNTAGSTNSTSKLFLIGATEQSDNPQTYSNSAVFATAGTLNATAFVSGDGINDFSAGTVKLDTLNIPTSAGGTTFGPGAAGQVLKSNGTTVYWGDGGAGGGLDITALQNYLTQNSYLNVTSGDNRYLKLSGGRMDSTSYIRWNDGHEGNDFSDWNSVAGETGLKIISSIVSTSNAPSTYSTALHVKGRYGFQLASIGGGDSKFYIRNIRDISDWCQLIHSGNINSFAWTSSNDGTGSGLDADLLDGQHGSWYLNNVIAFNRFNYTGPNQHDANVGTSGMLYNYGSNTYWRNTPDMSYGQILTLRSGNTLELAGQLAWDIKHKSTTDTTRYLWWRATDDGTWTEAKWHRIAYAEEMPTVTNYYWANIKVQSTEDKTTVPTFGGIIDTPYIRSNTTDGYYIGNRNTGAGTTDNGLLLYTYGGTPISFYTKKTERVRITSDGNVGIGTIAPEFKLHTVGKIVSKSTQNSVRLIPDEDCGLYMTSSGQWIHIAGSGREMYIYNGTWDNKGTGNYNKGITISTTNNIGIGTPNPAYKLDVNGSVYGNHYYGNTITLYTRGSGTYTRAWISAKDDAGDFIIEAPLTTDSASGTRAPITLTWRGGFPSKGGLKITGYSEAVLGGNKIWHAGNDGSGSGLDADTVDGIHASAFAQRYHTQVQLKAANSYTRVCTISESLSAGVSCLVNIRAHYNNTVHNVTFLCTATHSSRFNIIELSNAHYSSVKIRIGSSSSYGNPLTIDITAPSSYAAGQYYYVTVIPLHEGCSISGSGAQDVSALAYSAERQSTTGGAIALSGVVYAAHFYENSDIKLKKNIKNINSSDNMPLLKEFDWKSDGSHGYGLIAQELEAMGYHELVSGEEDGCKTVNYSAALSLIVGKLQVKIKELEKEIEILKNKN